MYIYIYKQNVKFPLNPTNCFEMLRSYSERSSNSVDFGSRRAKKQQGNVSQNARTFQVND